MVQLKGIYSDGVIKLDKNVSTSNPVPVIVTFIDDVIITEKISDNSFSFKKCRTLLKNLNTSFSDTVLEERRSAL